MVGNELHLSKRLLVCHAIEAFFTSQDDQSHAYTIDYRTAYQLLVFAHPIVFFN